MSKLIMDSNQEHEQDKATMNDHEIVLTIQDLLDGVEWSTDTLSQIADLLIENGYKIRDIDVNQEPPTSAADRLWADPNVGD